MTSSERIMAAVGLGIPDRVPQFLPFTHYGAKHLYITPKAYFKRTDLVVKAQLEMREKYGNDLLFAFMYAAVETEAMGGEVLYPDSGPPNAGEPIFKTREDIFCFEPPDPEHSPVLQRTLEVIRLLSEQAGPEIPIVGVVVSPFCLPIMQMGFESYLRLLYWDRAAFDELMRKNSAFCVKWANAQFRAGASAIGYFGPLASPDMLETQTYLKTGYAVDRHTLQQFAGPASMHLASGVALPIMNEIVNTGAAMVGFSADDDLAGIKESARGRICLMGNLNALSMVHWDTDTARGAVKTLIQKAGPGGGLILSDNHGEIPIQVKEDTLLAIADAVREFGRYTKSGDLL